MEITPQIQAKIDSYWVEFVSSLKIDCEEEAFSDPAEPDYAGAGYHRVSSPDESDIVIDDTNPYGGAKLRAHDRGGVGSDGVVLGEDELSHAWPTQPETSFKAGDRVLIIAWHEYGYGGRILLHPETLTIESWS